MVFPHKLEGGFLVSKKMTKKDEMNLINRIPNELLKKITKNHILIKPKIEKDMDLFWELAREKKSIK